MMAANRKAAGLTYETSEDLTTNYSQLIADSNFIDFNTWFVKLY